MGEAAIGINSFTFIIGSNSSIVSNVNIGKNFGPILGSQLEILLLCSTFSFLFWFEDEAATGMLIF